MKSEADAHRAEIEGYAAIYDRPDQSGDIVRRGAFGNPAPKLILTPASRVMMLYQHAVDRPIGRWTAFRENQKGLIGRGEIFLDTEQGLETYNLLRGGAIDGLSIGFKPLRVRRLREGRRELLSVDLWEVSIVTFPMSPDARITRIGEPGTPLPTNLLQN